MGLCAFPNRLPGVLISPALIESLETQFGALEPNAVRVAWGPADLRPLDLVRSGSDQFPFAGYLSTPAGRQIAGLGAAWQTVAPFGPDRFSAFTDEVRQFEEISPHLRVLVGFSFSPEGGRRPEWDGFTPTSGVVPLIAAIREDGETKLVVTLPPGRSFGSVADVLRTLEVPPPPMGSNATDHAIESRPSPSQYEQAVADAVGQIRAGGMAKAVLARSVVVTSDITPRPFELVNRLGHDYPACYVFGWQQGDGVFVGASPELLVAVEGGRVSSHPLAGSAPRGEGDEADRGIGDELMASAKNRVEHRVVVDDIAARLAPLVTELQVDRYPSLRKLTHVQHLSSEVAGTLSHPMTVIDVAGALHPTPAVGGSPRDEALAFLDKCEGLDRGWYAGGIGWMSADGDGEIAVALRCALLRGNQAFLYAGAGIVADSVPSVELEETRLKFRTMLQMLTEA